MIGQPNERSLLVMRGDQKVLMSNSTCGHDILPVTKVGNITAPTIV